MILRINKAQCIGSFLLDLTFNNGVSGVVDVRPLLYGPIFEPLCTFDRFAEFTLDPVCGTIAWPNGADLSPESLFDLLPSQKSAPRRVGVLTSS